MPRGVPREKGAGRVDRASVFTNTPQNIPSLQENEDGFERSVYAEEKSEPVKKKATGTMSKTKANPVTVLADRRDLTPAEMAEHKKFVTDSNIQGRFEAMDRNVKIPLERY
jgi:hypothetical protein